MIKGNVVGQKLCADFPYIVGGSIDYLTAEFTFSDEWKGLDIWAHFSHGGTTYDIRLKDGKIEREDHLNLSDGHWHLYLHGTKEGMRITTNEVLFVVDESGAINGEPLPEIPLSAAEQIALDASDAREIAASVRKDADDGVFDGKPFTYEDFTPEQLAGLKGETGDTGATGVGVLSVEQTVKSNEDDGENQFEITLTNGDTYTFGVKNGSKGSTGETGATGATGETGVGIKSVEQTVVSTEDDGVNVFTITLTNDEQYTVEVRNGSKGSQGDKGDTGVGIESVKQTSTSTEDDGENVVTVRLTNGVEETLTFKNGSKGSQGIQGVQGVQGIQGESGKDGASVTVSNVSESTADGGNNIVTFSDGKTLTVKNGSKGSKGDKGDKGADGTMTFEDLTPEQKESLRGDQGIQGERGADGTSVTIASVTESTEDSGSNVVTFSDGKALIVKNGSKGSKGDKGDRGEAGQGFEISKTYASVAAMNAGYATDGVPINGFVLIETGNVEDADNAKLFVKLETGYSYLTDLSGAQGIKGERGEAGSDGKDGTSVMVANVTESSEDGGANVVVFSDGKSVTVKNGHRGSQGEKGETGAAGSNGVSVSSVVQTTTSSADGGENIITVTLSNGEKFTFSVKNGNKGSQGIQGEQGIQGIQGVQGIQGESGKDGTSVTVSNVSESTADGGNNIVTFSDGKTLTVKNGSKGSKGDTGEVDYSRLNGYLPLSGGTLTDNLYLGAGAIPASNYGAVLGTDNLRFFQLFGGEYYFANVDTSYNSPYKFGMYQWDDNFTFVTRWAAGNSFYKDAWQINGETAVTNFTERPTVQGAGVALQSEIPSVPTLKTETWTFTLEDGTTVTKAVYIG